MIRTLLLVLAVALVAVVAAGCGGDDEPATTSEPTGTGGGPEGAPEWIESKLSFGDNELELELEVAEDLASVTVTVTNPTDAPTEPAEVAVQAGFGDVPHTPVSWETGEMETKSSESTPGVLVVTVPELAPDETVTFTVAFELAGDPVGSCYTAAVTAGQFYQLCYQ